MPIGRSIALKPPQLYRCNDFLTKKGKVVEKYETRKGPGRPACSRNTQSVGSSESLDSSRHNTEVALTKKV